MTLLSLIERPQMIIPWAMVIMMKYTPELRIAITPKTADIVRPARKPTTTWSQNGPPAFTAT